MRFRDLLRFTHIFVYTDGEVTPAGTQEPSKVNARLMFANND